MCVCVRGEGVITVSHLTHNCDNVSPKPWKDNYDYVERCC